MKKRLILGICICTLIMLTGCSKTSENDIIKKMKKKIDDAKAYHITGNLQIISHEEKYLYDVDVAYEKEEKFRVSLKNQTNNHEQIILKNDDGVYVLTPSLNKSFKFQSEWPYNNSQTYLLQNIITDIKSDKNRKFETSKEGYIFTVKANYSNNKELTTQKIYINKKLNVTKVEVMNREGQSKMTMNYKTVDMKSNYDKKYFELKDNMSVSVSGEVKKTSKISDIVYPMYLPNKTKLTAQDRIKTTNGERVILTFTGEKPFTIIEETANIEKESSIIPVSGEIEMVSDVFGNVADKSISWVNNNMEYYVASESLSKAELLEIANSISVLPVSK